MKLHELISSKYVKEAPTWAVKGNPHLDMPKPAQTASRDLTPNTDILGLDNNTGNMTSDFTKSDALNILKSIVRKARGKESIIKTDGGTEVSVKPFGDEKSISFKKTF